MLQINSKQWKEFKEWRKNEFLKIIKSKEYEEKDNRVNRECTKKLGFCETTNVYFIRHLRRLRDDLFSEMPEETLEDCYIWLLDNNKIK